MITDADFSGEHMSVVTGRHLEFLVRSLTAKGYEMPPVFVDRIALTLAQVDEIEQEIGKEIPRAPDEYKDGRLKREEGRVELNALPIFAPGWLRRQVEQALEAVTVEVEEPAVEVPVELTDALRRAEALADRLYERIEDKLVWIKQIVDDALEEWEPDAVEPDVPEVDLDREERRLRHDPRLRRAAERLPPPRPSASQHRGARPQRAVLRLRLRSLHRPPGRAGPLPERRARTQGEAARMSDVRIVSLAEFAAVEEPSSEPLLGVRRVTCPCRRQAAHVRRRRLGQDDADGRRGRASCGRCAVARDRGAATAAVPDRERRATRPVPREARGEAARLDGSLFRDRVFVLVDPWAGFVH